MSPAVLAACGVLAGVVSILDGVPYIRDTLRGTTRPHRGTWLIWASLAVLALASQQADGGRWSLVLVAVQAVVTVTIFALAVRRGVGGLSAPEVLLLGVAAAGVVGWWRFDDPVVATACVVAADGIGAVMMIPKAWRDPWSETLVSYVLAAVSGLLGTVAVGALDYSLLLYPGYFTLANAVLATVIAVRRRPGRPLSAGFSGFSGLS